MSRYFTTSFFKFLGTFLLIIVCSLILLVITGMYKNSTEENTVEAQERIL